MTKTPTQIGASVRARLLHIARERGEDFQLLLTQYANERFLYRLAESPHGSRFVLKGAALFVLWTGHQHRATRDLDLLGFGDPSEASIRATFTEILGMDVEEDGVVFDLASLKVGPIREQQDYGGLRVVLVARVTSAKVRLQVDIGFGDAVTPEARSVEFPGLLDFPTPRLRAYPPETVVAEKVEAMVQLGLANSRMKDFYDLAVLSRMFEFDGDLLVRAIRATFERRGTPLPKGVPTALTAAFTADATKRTQWAAFVRKSGAEDASDLDRNMSTVARFIAPPLAAAAAGSGLRARWSPLGPWQDIPPSE